MLSFPLPGDARISARTATSLRGGGVRGASFGASANSNRLGFMVVSSRKSKRAITGEVMALLKAAI
jgi:hypothetical protein